MNKHTYNIHEYLLQLAEGVKQKGDDTKLWNLLNEVSFHVNLYARDYVLTYGMKEEDAESLLLNIKECIQGMIDYIPEFIKNHVPSHE